MQKGNLNDGPLFYTEGIAPIRIDEHTFGAKNNYFADKVSNDLRFFYSLGHALLTSNGKQQFITERSAIKVHPGIEITFEMKRGTKLYEIQVQKSEDEILKDLTTKYNWFFDTLAEEDKKEWNSVVNEGLDYTLPDEPNAKNIDTNMQGIIIAPAFSRFKNNIGNGWNMMPTRGSKILGVGSDANYVMRPQEQIHQHKILHEAYVCLGGELELIVDGAPHELKSGDYLIAKPGEFHAMGRFIQIPYEGMTLQLPPVIGDKFDINGDPISRYFKK